MYDHLDIESGIQHLLRRMKKLDLDQPSFRAPREYFEDSIQKFARINSLKTSEDKDREGDSSSWLSGVGHLLRGDYLATRMRTSFVAAWCMSAWPAVMKTLPIGWAPLFFESPESWDPEAYWRSIHRHSDRWVAWARSLHGGSIPTKGREHFDLAWFVYSPSFLLEREDYGRILYDKVRSFDYHGVNSKAGSYDVSPAARYSNKGTHGEKDPNFYLSSDGVESMTGNVFRICMELDRLEEASECLFRMQHAYAWMKPPPKADKGSHYRVRITHFYSYQAHLAARLERDPERRRALAWTAIYWLAEWALNCCARVVGPGLNCKWGNPVLEMIRILADCDVLEGAEREEFMRHLKVPAMLSCPSTARKLLADPTPMATWKELGMPSFAETNRMYLEEVKKLGATPA